MYSSLSLTALQSLRIFITASQPNFMSTLTLWRDNLHTLNLTRREYCGSCRFDYSFHSISKIYMKLLSQSYPSLHQGLCHTRCLLHFSRQQCSGYWKPPNPCPWLLSPSSYRRGQMMMCHSIERSKSRPTWSNKSSWSLRVTESNEGSYLKKECD